MTGDEAERLLKRIVDTWPGANWTAGALAIWRKELASLELKTVGPDGAEREVARRAYESIRDTLGARTPPAWADFLAAYKAALPRPEWQSPLDDPPVSAERAREHLAECRAILTKSHPT